MPRRHVLIIVFFWSSDLNAADVVGAKDVVIRGCPVETGEPDCLRLRYKGQDYDISAIPMKPKLHYLGIEIRGRLSDPHSTYCKISNTPLEDIYWNGKYLRMKCD